MGSAGMMTCMIPRDLIVLVRERLGGSNLHYEKEGEIREKKQNAGLIAGQLMARGINLHSKLLVKRSGGAKYHQALVWARRV